MDKHGTNIRDWNENLKFWPLSRTFSSIGMPHLEIPSANNEEKNLCDILSEERVIGLTWNLLILLT